MNRERLKELLPVMQHYANGGAIQFKLRSGWEDFEDGSEPTWSGGAEYRIKPEPEYVPLEAEDWIKDGPWWVKAQGQYDDSPAMIVKINSKTIWWITADRLVNHSDYLGAMQNLVRRNSTSDWMPCKKPKQ